MANRQLGTFICNNCGEEVHRKAKVCPNCGADDETAWKEGANRPIYLTQEDDDFDVVHEHDARIVAWSTPNIKPAFPAVLR